jgi:hypothetical protein
MKYINAIIKESLRIYPPSPVINLRKPTKPIKVGSYVIPKDILCIANIWQIHHDPKYWENPDQYNPDRFLIGEKRHPFSWIPFSAGHRNWYVLLTINITVEPNHLIIQIKTSFIIYLFTYLIITYLLFYLFIYFLLALDKIFL